MAQPPTRHSEPARGVLAGIRADAKRAKEGGGDKKAGVAWSHNFLNQKPWHPSNFRNQARVFEAEQQSAQAAKSNAIAKAEFEAEQEKLKQLSYLSAAEQKKYADRQSIAFMYMKPPGYDAAQKRDEQVPPQPPDQGAASQAEPAATAESARPDNAGGRNSGKGAGRHVGNMLDAMAALQNQDRFEMKFASGLGNRSPPRGGQAGTAANQQILVSSSEDDDPGGQEGDVVDAKRQKLDQAEAFLKAAGISVPEVLARSSTSTHKEKRDRKHKHKHKKDKKARKEQRHRRHEESAD